MTQIAFDFAAAMQQINNCPALATATFALGRHTITIEKITTVWHMKWNGMPDFAFRIVLDGKPVYEPALFVGGRQTYAPSRAFFKPCLGIHRQILGARVFASKPAWMPREITMKVANAAFDTAALSII